MVWKPLIRLLSVGSSKSSKGSSVGTSTNKGSTNDSQSSHITTGEHDSASAPLVLSNLEPAGSDIQKDAPSEDIIPTHGAPVALKDKNGVNRSSEVNACTVFKTTPTLSNEDATDTTGPERAPLALDPFVKKYPFTKNHDLMDDMLDGMLMMRSFITEADTRRGQVANNVGAVAKVMAEGIKIRDFAAKPASASVTSPKDDSTSLLQGNPVVELFLAREKVFQFCYMRFLVKNGIYDLPSYPFTVDDVDRLYTCGLIGPDDLDNVLLCSMMGHGAYRRSIRSSGKPFFDGKVLPPRGQWTVPLGQERPTEEEINAYIALHEMVRFNRRYAINMYRIAAFERPLMTGGYIRHRVERDGFWGLKRLAGLSDEQAIELSNEKDVSFIPTKTYLEKWNENFPRTEVTAPPVPQSEDSPIASASLQQAGCTSLVPADHISGDAPQPNLSSSLIMPSEPPNSSPPHVPTLPSTPKGKKRARSPSPSFEEDDDDSIRRTRARLSEQPPSINTTTNADAASPTEHILRRSTRRIAGKVTVPEASTSQALSPTSTSVPSPEPSSPKGKKRSRGDEPEVEILDSGSSPSKKAKTTNDVALIRPAVPGPSGAPSTDLIPVNVADAPAGVSDASSAESGSGSMAPAATRSANSTTPNQPARKPLRRQRLMKYNPATDKLEDLVTGEVMSIDPGNPDWPVDLEQAKVYAGLDGRFGPTWAELCARGNSPAPVAFADIKAIERQPQSQPQASGSTATPSPPTSGPSEVAQPLAPPRRMPLQRHHMVYLDEVFPQYHPRWYGRKLVRQPMKYLDEVLPDLIPKWVPTESTT